METINAEATAKMVIAELLECISLALTLTTNHQQIILKNINKIDVDDIEKMVSCNEINNQIVQRLTRVQEEVKKLQLI